MKKLIAAPTPPTAVSRYIGIRDSKKLVVRRALVADHASVSAQYSAFDAAASSGNLESLTADASCAAITTQLRACYGGATKALVALKEEIVSTQPRRQLKFCPMCGTTKHSTFDHYIPSAKYPEFSVHAHNLVPCCFLCNSTKDDDWLDLSGRRMYLHSYTDALPAQQFIFVDLIQQDGLDFVGATFSLSRPIGVQNEVWRLITSHFTRLRLLERYAYLSNDEIAEILSTCKDYLDEGGKRPRHFLRRMGSDRARVYGTSHWQAVLMKSLADHVEFRNWLSAL